MTCPNCGAQMRWFDGGNGMGWWVCDSCGNRIG